MTTIETVVDIPDFSKNSMIARTLTGKHNTRYFFIAIFIFI